MLTYWQKFGEFGAIFKISISYANGISNTSFLESVKTALKFTKMIPGIKQELRYSFLQLTWILELIGDIQILCSIFERSVHFDEYLKFFVRNQNLQLCWSHPCIG